MLSRRIILLLLVASMAPFCALASAGDCKENCKTFEGKEGAQLRCNGESGTGCPESPNDPDNTVTSKLNMNRDRVYTCESETCTFDPCAPDCRCIKGECELTSSAPSFRSGRTMLRCAGVAAAAAAWALAL